MLLDIHLNKGFSKWLKSIQMIQCWCLWENVLHVHFPCVLTQWIFFFFPDNDSWIKTCNILCLKTKCSLNIEEESIKHLHVTILHKTVGCAAYMCSQKGPVLHHLLWTELHFKRHLTCHQLEERLFYLQRNANLQSVRADLFIRSWQSLVQLSGDT